MSLHMWKLISFPVSSETVPTAAQRKVTLKLPLPPKATTSKRPAATVEDADEEDEDYVVPKRHRAEPTSPSRVYNTDGEEQTECTEIGEKLVSEVITLYLFIHAISGKET